MTRILEIENLSKSFDGVTPIKNITFAVNQQTVTLITGENGAGKTTLFNLITGLEKPTSGEIFYQDYNITAKSSLEISQLGIVRLFQQPRLFKSLSVWENLVSASPEAAGNRFFNLVFTYKKVKSDDGKLKEQAVELLEKFGLRNLANQTAGELSYGQQKLISFCMICMAKARLALLDEPFAGLNPQIIEQFGKMILQMKSEGIAFLIIEHNINKALQIADFHIEMKNGLITASEITSL